jgi:hypothetical protein
MSNFFYRAPLASRPQGLGPAGPFPRAQLTHPLDRRWLHYALLSKDGNHSLVANAAWLGPSEDGDRERFTTILLVHERGGAWTSSQFNAEISTPAWSAFGLPHQHNEPSLLSIAARGGEPAVDLQLHRTSRPCTSQCAFFGRKHHLRWQSETGIHARGKWQMNGQSLDVDALGYHERVRGRWGWPELGEWVFGFANDLAGDPERPPAWAGVFTFIRPRDDPRDTTASFMLWRNGRMCRHFSRRMTSFAVRGALSADALSLTPPLARLLGVTPMAPIPKHLAISARQGKDWVVLEFESEAAARVAIPSETSINAFSVHEVVGPCLLAGHVSGKRFEIETRGIVEFSGGASGD